MDKQPYITVEVPHKHVISDGDPTYIPEEDREDMHLANKLFWDHKHAIPNEDPKMSCRETVLEEAKRCVCTDRQNQYGSPENSFNYISDLWTMYLQNEKGVSIEVTATDVALMMILLKIARTSGHKSYSDNYVDMAGYSALAAELSMDKAMEDWK